MVKRLYVAAWISLSIIQIIRAGKFSTYCNLRTLQAEVNDHTD